MESNYFSISKPAIKEKKIKNSRFTGLVERIESEEHFRLFLERVKKKYYSASHYCFAFRVMENGYIIERSNDDGEPAGSAGAPILKILSTRNYLNTGLIVVRYFGGIKLGIGGLIRAYGGTASETLDAAGRMEHHPLIKGTVIFPPGVTGPVNNLIEKMGIKRGEAGFRENVTMEIEVPVGEMDKFARVLSNTTSGKAVVKFEHPLSKVSKDEDTGNKHLQ